MAEQEGLYRERRTLRTEDVEHIHTEDTKIAGRVYRSAPNIPLGTVFTRARLRPHPVYLRHQG